MNASSETREFFAASEVAAKQDARRWIAAQSDILLTMDIATRQTSTGGWVAIVTFQRKPKAI
jgi:hypothetical protein